METKASYGLLRKECANNRAAAAILSEIEEVIIETPFDWAVLDFGTADNRTEYMYGLARALVIVLDSELFDDVTTIMASVMVAFYEQ